jgi:integrase
MSRRKFTPFVPRVKPEKPTEDFPLFAHANGTWAKKIRGKLHYFGPWSDPDAALAKYQAEKDDLHAGRLPRGPEESGELTVYQLCAQFLTTKQRLCDSGELSGRSLADYSAVCKLLLKHFGKSRLVLDLRASDFERLRDALPRTWGLVRVGNTINKIRIVFNYAHKNGLIPRPLVYGEGFRRPSQKALRKHRQAQGPRVFEAEEIRRVLAGAGQPLKTMILLAINCGFGNSDVGNLPLAALDLERGWIDYPRPKTAIERRIPLWPETVQALGDWLVFRPRPAREEDAGLVFLTATGGSWARDNDPAVLSKQMRKLLHRLGVNGHRNFYTLRHCFQTIGDESGDFLAVRRIMGHASNDIADAYRERTSDERLRKVTEHVRAWLFALPPGEGEEPVVLKIG